MLSKYNPCSKHEDCVATSLDAKCSGAGSCPPLYVNREMKAGFGPLRELTLHLEIVRSCSILKLGVRTDDEGTGT